jgi:hypothetical protein
MTLPHETPDYENAAGRIANVVQALSSTLFLHPDDPEICLPRPWLTTWLRDLLRVLEYLRRPQ